MNVSFIPIYCKPQEKLPAAVSQVVKNHVLGFPIYISLHFVLLALELGLVCLLSSFDHHIPRPHLYHLCITLLNRRLFLV
jgi:hypothetical protein